jgi:alpha-tubulin suppressor-like RCC1 family protein
MLSIYGTVYTCGENYDGQLGLGDFVDRNLPSRISALNGMPIVKIATSAHSSHSLVLSFSGAVYAFGRNEFGQLGMGTLNGLNLPSQIMSLNGTQIDLIATGMYHSMVVANIPTRDVYSFGGNSRGQLCQGHTQALLLPTFVKTLKDKGITRLSLGAQHSLMSGDVFYGCGDNGYAQLGFPDLSFKMGPQQNPYFLGDITSIAAGTRHSVVISPTGVVNSFGLNDLGQLGLGDTALRPSPTQILSLNGQKIAEVSSGAAFSLGISGLKERFVYAWGDNTYGQLGLGYAAMTPVPTQVNSLNGFNVTIMSKYGDHAILSTDRGNIWAFGGNTNGQLGLGDTTNRFSPSNSPFR